MAKTRKFIMIPYEEKQKKKIQDFAKSEYGMPTASYIRMLIANDMKKRGK